MPAFEEFYSERIKNLKTCGTELVGDCPECGKPKHFYINTVTGQFQCKRCGVDGNIITYLRDFEDKNNNEIAAEYKQYSPANQPLEEQSPPKRFTKKLILHYVSNLTEEKLDEFATERGLPVKLLKEYRLGIDSKDQYTLPVFNEDGEIVDIRRKKIGAETRASSGAKTFLFGIKDLLNNETIFVTEGEWSKLALQAQGFASVGVPGANTFKDDWVNYFKDKEVYFVYDNDDPGRSGAKKAASMISPVAKSVKIINLPAELGDKKDVRDYFNSGATKEDFKKLVNSAESTALSEFHNTDIGNGQRLVSLYKKHIRYCQPRHAWCVYQKTHWRVDDTMTMMSYAKNTVRSMYDELQKIQDKSEKIKFLKFISLSENAARIDGMLSLARSEPGVPILPEEFDKNNMLFNCLNGTIDLHTRELHKHKETDYISKIAKVIYDPESKCPKFEAFLLKIMNNNENLTKYLQRVAGYCLTGETSEHKLFFLYGSGKNGKTTFLNVLLGIMGDYALRAGNDVILLKDGAHTTSLTDLKGARLAITAEVNEGVKLATGLVKGLTGDERITARRMHENNISFEPTHKICLAANHKPVIEDSTEGMWRRIDLIPFTVEISATERILGYHKILLQEESSGILNWALQGCTDWLKSGLSEPKEVIAATKEYRNESDEVGEFLEEICVISQKELVDRKTLYAAYISWVEKSGDEGFGTKAFASHLKAKGILDGGTKKGNRRWKGLRLKTADELKIEEELKNDEEAAQNDEKVSGEGEVVSVKVVEPQEESPILDDLLPD